jgi:hypothetical protein
VIEKERAILGRHRSPPDPFGGLRQPNSSEIGIPVAGSTQASGFEVRAKCRWADKSRERMKKTADNCNAPLQLSRNFCSITATGRCDYYIIFA